MLKNFQKNIDITIKAHSLKYVKEKENAFRFVIKNVPYSIHPIWCAMTILTETKLPDNLRKLGYQVLLFHDIIEDSKYNIEPNVSEEVYALIREMTFKNLREEIEKIHNVSDFGKLLKLYDKTSNLLDGSWMSIKLKTRYIEYTRFLIDFSQKCYGELNIIIISKNICDEIEKTTTPNRVGCPTS
jgi:(p)ppGpp synthase/HD superfamily hydrolase